jgi:hypothetical protein
MEMAWLAAALAGRSMAGVVWQIDQLNRDAHAISDDHAVGHTIAHPHSYGNAYPYTHAHLAAFR